MPRTQQPRIHGLSQLTEEQRRYLIERRTESQPPPTYERIRTDFFTRYRIRIPLDIIGTFYEREGLRRRASPAPAAAKAAEGFLPSQDRTLIDEDYDDDERSLAEYLEAVRGVFVPWEALYR